MADTNNLPEATRKTLEKLVAAIGHLGLKKDGHRAAQGVLAADVGGRSRPDRNCQFLRWRSAAGGFCGMDQSSSQSPIEIELIASGGGDFSKEVEPVSFLTPPGTMPSKVFSRVARVNHGKLIYVSGLYGMKAGDSGDRSGRFLPRWRGVEADGRKF